MQENLLDQVRLNFSPEGLLLLNIILGFIMFGVALELKLQHFRDLLKNPRAYIAGITSQFIFLPIVTFLLVLILKPMPGIALGMILVASCPGGNISNFFSSLAKGNTALSVSLTALSTLLAVIMTPLNFNIWGGLYLGVGNSPGSISLDPADMFMNILLILGVPVLIGMLFSVYFPQITKKIIVPFKKASMGIFILFVIIAFSNNFGAFINYIHLVIGLVFLHNLFAVLTGYIIGASFGLKKIDRRTIAIETGIQNSGLGLLIIFTFMEGIGSMAIVTAWWGIWHIISGFFLAFIWSKKPVGVYA